MPDSVSDHTNLKTQYAAQVAADLENNTKEQERIGSDIAALQSQLRQLEHDHALLLSMQQALVTEPAAAPAGTATASGRLPRARRPKDSAPGRGAGAKSTPASRGAKAADGKQGKGAGRGAGAGRAARGGRSGGPTLREVVSGLLAGHDSPRSAAEVTSDLARSHPERTVSPTVVRNTLEALVAKGLAHRSKQQKAVFYSAVSEPAAAKADSSSPQESAAAGDGAGES